MGKQRRRKELWAYTAFGPHRINIYQVWYNNHLHGCCYRVGDGYAIEIHHTTFDDPALLADTILHEFVHVIEGLVPFTLHDLMPNDPDGTCTRMAVMLGHGLSQLLREFRQMAWSESETSTFVSGIFSKSVGLASRP